MTRRGRPRPPIRIAVSGCLLGEAVRYDGGHRQSSYVTDNLAAVFELVSECPEVGIGLGVPRPKIRLERGVGAARLLGSGNEDLTAAMTGYTRVAADRFHTAGIAGIVLKSRSPSCGTGDVKLHEDGAVVSEDATGVFATGMAESLPGVPRISEVDLDDPARRDHWLTRVFALAELRELGTGSQEISKLHDFHARWKMVLMAHSERTARRLGRSLAATRDARTALPRYQDSFLAGLAEAASVGTHRNVLLHLAGHLKRRLDPADRSRLGHEISAFHAREVPLAVPVRSLAGWATRLRVGSLVDQAYLAERPNALGYREEICPE